MMDEAIFFGETLEDRTVVAIVDAGKAGAGNFDDAETERAEVKTAALKTWCASVAREGLRTRTVGPWRPQESESSASTFSMAAATPSKSFLRLPSGGWLLRTRRDFLWQLRRRQTFFKPR